MRPILTRLSGMALLALAAYLVATRSTDDLAVITPPTVPMPSRKPSELTTTSRKHSPVSRTLESTSGGIPSPPTPTGPIRLGNDVRLPAALMHQATATVATTPEIAAARQGIIDSFYQELSTHAAGPQLNSPIVGAESINIIPTGQDTDAARKRADEAYRALYGNEAYNRHSINSALEVRLPALSE